MLGGGQSVYRKRRRGGCRGRALALRQRHAVALTAARRTADFSAATEGISRAPSAVLKTDRQMNQVLGAPGHTLTKGLFWVRRFSWLLPVASDDRRPRLSAFER